MTDAQKSAKDKVWDIIKEHFDHAVLLIETEAEEDTDRIFICNYHSGITTAIGLCERGKHYWINLDNQKENEV